MTRRRYRHRRGAGSLEHFGSRPHGGDALPPIDAQGAIGVLAAVGISVVGEVRAVRVPSGNDVFRLSVGEDAYFVKAPAKDLEAWPDAFEGAAAKVAREDAAAACLRRHGLPGPEVIVADVGSNNPIGRPHLLTHRVPGRPFTSVVLRRARHGWAAPLLAIGTFLAAVHRIEFERAGYVTSSRGPNGPAPPAPPLPVHAPDVAAAAALRDLDSARPFLDPDLRSDLETRFRSLAGSIEADYRPPRLVLGGFHPNHPFLGRVTDGWSVVGCIDLEVASGGRVFDDLATFAVGMMFRVDSDIPWWEPLFEGYGSTPELETFRAELLANCSYLFGASPDINGRYRALLAAVTWGDLFHIHRSG